jgi:hypothetical protein
LNLQAETLHKVIEVSPPEKFGRTRSGWSIQKPARFRDHFEVLYANVRSYFDGIILTGAGIEEGINHTVVC